MRSYENICYKTGPTGTFHMDIYVPDAAAVHSSDGCSDTVRSNGASSNGAPSDRAPLPPVILWIHGGSWNMLNRSWNLLLPMTERGYAVAQIDYTYSDIAPFPAQMYDLKDAVRFLKQHGRDYGYDASRIAVAGDSSGAHLANLLAVSAGYAPWENVPAAVPADPHGLSCSNAPLADLSAPDYSVQAAIDLCGPVSLYDMLPEDAASYKHAAVFEGIMGVPVTSEEFRARSKAACPLTYIDGTEPPFLIIHGTRDNMVDPAEGRRLRNALEAVNVPSHMYLIPGGAHSMGGDLLYDHVKEFLDYYLKGITTVTKPRVQPEHMR